MLRLTVLCLLGFLGLAAFGGWAERLVDTVLRRE